VYKQMKTLGEGFALIVDGYVKLLRLLCVLFLLDPLFIWEIAF